MKNFKIMLSVFMAIIIILVSVIPSLAIVSPGISVSSKIDWKDKIDSIVWSQMEEKPDNEKIPVWVWFTDADTSQVENLVKKETGFSKNELSVKVDTPSDKLISALDTASIEGSQSSQMDVANEMKLYLDASEKARKEELLRTNAYLHTKREITKDLYVENNERIISALNIDNDNISFMSELTPSAIMNLTGSEIINIAKYDNVVSVDYYNYGVLEAPDYANINDIEDTMQIDAVKERYGCSGEYINVLMNDHGFVRSDLQHFDDIQEPLLIKNIYNHKQYQVTKLDVLPDDGYENEDHPNLVASVLQSCAQDVSIYATSHGRFSDIEWALQHCDIHLINGSVNYGHPTDYGNDSVAMWFDALVNEYDVTLLAAAGNDYDWSSENWPYVISPACCNNSIAVGAYTTDGDSVNDTMHDYRYIPDECTSMPSYKPDVVVAHNSTSEATPLLSGIVAMMIEINPELATKPEIIKAILMASCHRKVKSISSDTQEHMIDGLTLKQGAGAVDAYRAIKIVLDETYGYSSIVQGTQDVTTITLSDISDVNVSIAWLKDNEYSIPDSNNSNESNDFPYNITLGDTQNLGLTLYREQCINKISDVIGSGKQLVYLENATEGDYIIKVNKLTTNDDPIQFGYAWSNKDYEETYIGFGGICAAGRTITANVISIDNKSIEVDPYSYVWKISSDGTNWEVIDGVHTNTYSITNTDLFKYISCEVNIVSDLVSEQEKATGITTMIVMFGDVDTDGIISISDVTLLQSYLIKASELTKEQLIAADVDCDGSVTVIDKTHIQRYLAGLIPNLPV